MRAVDLAVLIVAFVAMEGVSYAAHRWVMHTKGMVLHASHHAAARGRLERNDAFPVIFAIVGMILFALAGWGPLPSWVWWAATGITAYGATYLVVHEIVIHRRVAVVIPNTRYLRWLRDSHRAHHLDGGEPYGMLLPVMSRRDRRRVASSTKSSLGEGVDDLVDRSTIRSARKRL